MGSAPRAVVVVFAVAQCLGCAGSASVAPPVTSATAPESTDMSPVDQTSDRFSFDPYRAVVRSTVLHSFERLSDGDPSAALDAMADDVRYSFEGEHALGGTRNSKAAVERWFARLLRLLPGRFAIRSVEVAGWPWCSKVVVQFEDTVTPAYGAPYRNRGVQVIDMRWGKAVQIQTYVDTDKVKHALAVLVEHGVAEAGAPPITD